MMGPVFVVSEGTREGPHPQALGAHALRYVAEGPAHPTSGPDGRPAPRTGTLTVMPAGVPLRPLAPTARARWLVSFCPTCLGLSEGLPVMRPFQQVRHGAVPYLRIDASRRTWVGQLFHALDDEARRDKPSPEALRSMLSLLLVEAERAPRTYELPPEDEVVTEALQYVQRRCLDDITVDDVADWVDDEPAALEATIVAVTGHGIEAWIAEGRMAEAAARLTHTDDALDEIARHVGWAKRRLSERFRAAHGLTAARWREGQRGRHIAPGFRLEG